ncbi:MAG: LLM class flavin-dependent oxidoreductase, partial [Acidimicrobiia bacterium]
DFYTHTLMTPFFSPHRSPYGPPRVLLAAVGARMTEVAGEVADGLMVHPLNTARYLAEVTVPAIERGRALAGKTRGGFELSAPVLVVTGENEEAEARAAASVRSQIAFYASTPSYRGILELHGWTGLGEELNLMSKQGRWGEMGALIDDEMLEEFAIRAPLDQVAARLDERFGSLLDRISFYAPYVDDPRFWAPVVAGLGAGGRA